MAKHKWPDKHGKPIEMKDLDNEKLLEDTQRLVDAQRRSMDDSLFKRVSKTMEFSSQEIHARNKKMTFSGYIKSLVTECTRRGLDLNTER